MAMSINTIPLTFLLRILISLLPQNAIQHIVQQNFNSTTTVPVTHFTTRLETAHIVHRNTPLTIAFGPWSTCNAQAASFLTDQHKTEKAWLFVLTPTLP